MFILTQSGRLLENFYFENPEKFLDFLFSSRNIFGFSQNWNMKKVDMRKLRFSKDIYLIQIVYRNDIFNSEVESSYELHRLSSYKEKE